MNVLLGVNTRDEAFLSHHPYWDWLFSDAAPFESPLLLLVYSYPHSC